MKKRALLVGINYPGTNHALRGCVNDVMLMSEILTSRFGFPTKEKRMLTDASATTANILKRLDWLVEDAQPGDVLYFHYSGHGSQMIDTRYDTDDEPDGLDEIICPIDLNWRDKVITDDQLKAVFDKVPTGVNLTVVLDCCHSGSGLDQSYQYQSMGVAKVDYDPLSPNKNRLLPMPADIANRSIGLDIRPKPRSVRKVDDTGLLISGCQSHQTSADAFLANKFMGAATFFLSKTLQKHNYDISYKDLVDEMNIQLVEWNFTQRPELNGSVILFNGGFLQPLEKTNGDDEGQDSLPSSPLKKESIWDKIFALMEKMFGTWYPFNNK